MKKAMGIIYSNIYDSALAELTRIRTVASLPFGARYRQIDFVLSNMSNSGISKISVITKYNYQSLMDHLGSCQEWDLNVKSYEMKVLPPYANGHNGVYRGKLDALQNCMDFLKRSTEEYVILSDSTTICAMDFSEIVQAHEDSGKDVTVVLTKYDKPRAQHFQLTCELNEKQEIRDMCVEIDSNRCLAGMGIYVMSRTMLLEAVDRCVSRGYYHFERDFLLRNFNQGTISVNPYVFKSVALFNTSTYDYYNNSMELLKPEVFKGIFNRKGMTIYTKVRDSVPAYYGDDSAVSDSLIADGSRIHGTIDHSVIFREVEINSGASIKDCVIMQGCKIGEGAVLEGMILDKNVVIRPYTVLRGTAEHPIVIEKGSVI